MACPFGELPILKQKELRDLVDLGGGGVGLEGTHSYAGLPRQAVTPTGQD